MHLMGDLNQQDSKEGPQSSTERSAVVPSFSLSKAGEEPKEFVKVGTTCFTKGGPS